MELKTFITETLIQIQEGVGDAIAACAKRNDLNGVINPHFSDFREDLQSIVEKVSFDVAVTVTTAAEGEARGGLEVLGVGIGGKANIAKQDGSVSRIQFSVPVVPPTTQIDMDATRAQKARSEEMRARTRAAMQNHRGEF